MRFGVGFTLVGLTVGCFALGGLLYTSMVAMLVNRLGQTGLATGGGFLLAIGFLTLALQPVWWVAPPAMIGIGLGFYMLHNTLQTNATQMTPQARGTAVAIFSSSLYMGLTAGVAAGSLVVDRFTAVPVFFCLGDRLSAARLLFRAPAQAPAAARARAIGTDLEDSIRCRVFNRTRVYPSSINELIEAEVGNIRLRLANRFPLRRKTLC